MLLLLLQTVADKVDELLHQLAVALLFSPDQGVLHLAGGVDNDLFHQHPVGSVGGLGENADAHGLLGQGHRVQIVGQLADDVGLGADLRKPAAQRLHAGAAAGGDNGLVGQTAQRDGLALRPGQGVILGDHGDPGLPTDRETGQILTVVGGGHHGHVGQAPVQALQHLVAAAVPEAEFDIGELPAKAGNPAGQQERGAAIHHADIYRAGKTVEGLNLLLGLLGQFQQLHGPAIEQAPGLGQLQMALAADKERGAQLDLQGFDLVGQGRLAHVQPFGRPGDVEFFCGGDKITQRTQIHRASPQNSSVSSIQKTYEKRNRIDIFISLGNMLSFRRKTCGRSRFSRAAAPAVTGTVRRITGTGQAMRSA